MSTLYATCRLLYGSALDWSPVTHGQIDELEFDDDNEWHLDAHELTPTDVIQVFEVSPLFRPNKRGRAASVQMIGPKANGDILTVCLQPLAHRPGAWRPVTGWNSSEHELEWYNKHNKDR